MIPDLPLAQQVREKDWAQTPLGPRDQWPVALRVVVELLLAHPMPTILLWGPDLIQIYNDPYAVIAGAKHPTALGQRNRECWPEALPLTEPIYRRVLNHGEQVFLKDQLIPLDRSGRGSMKDAYFTLSYSPCRGDDGGIGGIFVTVIETTENVLAEREQAMAHDRINRLFEGIATTTPDFMYVFDRLGRFLYANRRLLEVWGRTLEDIVGKTCLELGYEQWHHDMHMGEIAEVLATKRAIRGEVPFTAPLTGIHGVYEYIFTPVLGSDGEVELVAGTTRDVTASRQAAEAARANEEQLRTSEERLAFSIEAAELGTFYCPMPLGLIVWNAKCKEHFWLPPDADVDFDRFYSILHPEDREPTRQAVQEAVFSRQGYDIEYRTVSPEGRIRWVRAKGKAYYAADGSATRFDGVTLDVTDRKTAEAERQKLLESERAARTEAERTSRIKDEFLATLSHELRTPLNAILGWSQIIRSDPKATEGLEIIERNARTQAQIIDDLLDMSAIISGKVRLDVQRVNLASVISAAVATVRPGADAKGVRLQILLDPLVKPVSGDPSRLHQVFWNLLSNAVKFTPRGGRVQVMLERVNSHLEVSVSDTGEGIAPDFLPHAFDRFRQADASTTRRHGGLGLGLSIAKQLVELHGGSISVASDGKGLGSTFRVAMPLMAAHADATDGDGETSKRSPSAGSAAADRAHPSLQGVSILVVDDEPDAQSLLRRLLEDCGATVYTAGSVGDAMDVLRAHRPNVLVSDIGMPEKDGYALIGEVRALDAASGGSIPAIALTAYARVEDRIRAVAAGFHMHISKPVEPAELTTMVASLATRF